MANSTNQQPLASPSTPADNAATAAATVAATSATAATAGNAAEILVQNAQAQPQNQKTDQELAQIHQRNALIRAWDKALTDMRQRSYEGKLTTPARWKRLAIAPQDMDQRDFETGLMDYISSHDHADDSPAIGQMEAPKPLDVILEGQEVDEDEPLPNPDVSDVVLLYGKKAVYLYSKPLLSSSFAHALFVTTENDDLSTFIDVVRTESRVYPRPVSILDFMNPPYLWPIEKTRELFESIGDEAAFADIHTCKTSLDETFFYSTRFLNDAQGKALAEFYGVEKGRNP